MLLTVLYFEAWNFKEFAAKEKLEIVQSEKVASFISPSPANSVRIFSNKNRFHPDEFWFEMIK